MVDEAVHVSDRRSGIEGIVDKTATRWKVGEAERAASIVRGSLRGTQSSRHRDLFIYNIANCLSFGVGYNSSKQAHKCGATQ
ncbi:hypothetical protein CERSUDRAFT_83258 [Gelatoporia subvermispora B]|uniref:Uncharacterized protein n=1 Tax=Ceriporiopsis subvermispora (strain B) TaxID=914234 RepID=M2RGE2_CERS8|nr:hypothetical protein CERSUDRAFT_83258 [Gelatoporia subvermispora B]